MLRPASDFPSHFTSKLTCLSRLRCGAPLVPSEAPMGLSRRGRVCVCISSSFRLTCLLFLLPSLVFSFTLLEEDARGLPPFRKPSTFFSLSWHLSASNSVVGPVSRFLASHQVDILSLLPRWFFHCSSEHGRGRTTTGAPLGYRLTSSAGEKREGGGEAACPSLQGRMEVCWRWKRPSPLVGWRRRGKGGEGWHDTT